MNIKKEVIKVDFITSFSIQVKEKINKKFLQSFLETSLNKNNITQDKNQYYYYIFLEDNLSYEILTFNTNGKKDFIPEPFLLFEYYNNKKETKGFDLFLLNNYFVLFKDKRLILYKKLNIANKGDILLYLNQVYSIEPTNIIELSSSRLKEYQKNFSLSNKDKRIKLHNFYRNNSFKYFSYFLISSFIILGYLIFHDYTNPNIATDKYKLKNIESKYKNIKIKYNTKKITQQLIDLFGYLKINGIYIEKINIDKGIVSTSIFHKIKGKLFDFTTIYSKNVRINSISHIKEKDIYKMEIKIEF